MEQTSLKIYVRANTVEWEVHKGELSWDLRAHLPINFSHRMKNAGTIKISQYDHKISQCGV